MRIRSIYHGLFLIFNLQSNCFLFHFIVIVLCCVSIFLFFVSSFRAYYLSTLTKWEEMKHTYLFPSFFFFARSLADAIKNLEREREKETIRDAAASFLLFPFQSIYLSISYPLDWFETIQNTEQNKIFTRASFSLSLYFFARNLPISIFMKGEL